MRVNRKFELKLCFENRNSDGYNDKDQQLTSSHRIYLHVLFKRNFLCCLINFEGRIALMF